MSNTNNTNTSSYKLETRCCGPAQDSVTGELVRCSNDSIANSFYCEYHYLSYLDKMDNVRKNIDDREYNINQTRPLLTDEEKEKMNLRFSNIEIK